MTISYQEPFAYSVSALCFQIFAVKLILRPKMVTTYAISLVNWIFLIILVVILCCLSEKGRKEIVDEIKERDREERGTGMKMKKQKK